MGWGQLDDAGGVKVDVVFLRASLHDDSSPLALFNELDRSGVVSGLDGSVLG